MYSGWSKDYHKKFCEYQPINSIHKITYRVPYHNGKHILKIPSYLLV